MKKYLLFLGCLAAISAHAQQDKKQKLTTQKEEKAVVTGFLKNAPNDSIITLYEPYSGEVDTAFIKNQRFTLNMPMPKGGSMYILKVGRNPDPKTGGMILYLESGKMHIEGNGTTLKNVKLSGDKWAKEWMEVADFLDESKGSGKILAETKAKYFKAMEIGDEDAADEYNRVGDSLMKIQNRKIRSFIQSHPNSGVTGYLATCYIKNRKERDSIVAGMGEHAKSSRIMKRFLFPGKYDPRPMTLSVDTASAPSGKKGVITIGKAAPDFSVPDADGKMLSLADFKGKYLFIDFWASWCGPCKPQIPFLKAANEKFKDKNFVMLAVSLDSKKEAWTKAIEKHELTWLNASHLKGWAEPVAVAYGISAIPSNVLIGPDGTVLAMGLYGDMIEKQLEALIK
ncbi:AhpC/TSA family protein [Chitinophaga sp. Mgbs1]|uniref:AhpC/TSA family protein n=1 Tax=Chitinophaga solisilvae TaxID=1233460 RepID=A0A3S1DQ85_9BACT|nr:AhpC/TSA family protein [Chitinophaga solisilvae]